MPTTCPRLERGMNEQVPQDFPAGEARLAAGKLHDELDAQADCGLLLEPATVAVPKFEPALREGVERYSGAGP
jgi:hypothetical protein